MHPVGYESQGTKEAAADDLDNHHDAA